MTKEPSRGLVTHLPVQIEILKSQLPAKFTTYHDYRADFWEFLPVVVAMREGAAAGRKQCPL